MKDTVQITLIATGFGQNGGESAAATQTGGQPSRSKIRNCPLAGRQGGW